jgi:hypothetical protein
VPIGTGCQITVELSSCWFASWIDASTQLDQVFPPSVDVRICSWTPWGEPLYVMPQWLQPQTNSTKEFAGAPAGKATVVGPAVLTVVNGPEVAPIFVIGRAGLMATLSQ